MDNCKLQVDNIYWERIQLFIEGHSKNIKITNKDFILRDVSGIKEVKANDVETNGNYFKARFNIAILDDGNYLPSGEYLFIYKNNIEYIAQINEDLINPKRYILSKKQWEKYSVLEKINDKRNYLLSYFRNEFQKNGDPKKTKYIVQPTTSISSKNFVLLIIFKKPQYKEKKRKINKLNIRDILFKFIFNISKKLYSRKSNVILFTSDSRAEMSGNFYFVYKEILRQNLDSKYRLHSFFKSKILGRRNFIDKFKFPYLLGKADYIFIDDFHPAFYKVNFRKNQEIIQLWHAVGAFKTVGFSRAGKIGGPFFDSLNHRNYTKVYVSSEKDVLYYAEAFGVKEQNVIPTGIPRTDILFDKNYKEKTIFRMKNKMPCIRGKKVILFAPTFRGNSHNTAYYPFHKINLSMLADYCQENNVIVLFKMHPFIQNSLHIPLKYKKYLKDVSNIREVNDLFFISDILISDYSSLIYEFAIFKRPMLFYAFDLEDYIASRDFYEPYEEFVPGKIVENFDDLLKSLKHNDFEEEKIDRFLKKHYKYYDGKASERIVQDLFGR